MPRMRRLPLLLLAPLALLPAPPASAGPVCARVLAHDAGGVPILDVAPPCVPYGAPTRCVLVTVPDVPPNVVVLACVPAP